MSLPTPTELLTMNFAYQGQPFVYVAAKSAIDLKTMDYAWLAQPFVANYGVGVGSIENRIVVLLLQQYMRRRN